jgi:hypothetical protein
MNTPKIIAMNTSTIPITIPPIVAPVSEDFLPMMSIIWMFGYKPLSATGDVTGGDVAPDTAVDVEDDVDESEELAMVCVVDVGEGTVCVVDVVGVIVALTLVGEDGESCPLRISSNDGGTILTVAHCCLNQIEVDSKSAPSQVKEMQ